MREERGAHVSQREGRKLFPPPAVVVNLVHGVQRAQVVHDVHVVQEVALRHPLKALPEAFP